MNPQQLYTEENKSADAIDLLKATDTFLSLFYSLPKENVTALATLLTANKRRKIKTQHTNGG